MYGDVSIHGDEYKIRDPDDVATDSFVHKTDCELVPVTPDMFTSETAADPRGVVTAQSSPGH